MATWKDVMDNPEFAKETPEAKAAIRDDYFNKVIKPQAEASGDDVDAVYKDFSSKYTFAPTQQKKEVDWAESPYPVIKSPSEMFTDPTIDLSGKSIIPSNVPTGYKDDGSLDTESSRWDGMTAQEILNQMEIDAEAGREMPESYSEVNKPLASGKKYGRDIQEGFRSEGVRSLEVDSTGQQLATEAGIQEIKDDLSKNPKYKDLDEEELDALANTKYRKGAAETALQVATWPITGGKTVIGTGLKMGGLSGAIEGASQLASGEELDSGEIISDAILGGTLGALFKGAEKGVDYQKGVKKLNELGKKADELIEEGVKMGDKARTYLEKDVDDGIKVRDIVIAREKADTVNELSKRGGKLGVQKVAERIERSPELRNLLLETRSPTEKLSKWSTENFGKVISQAIGLREGGLEKARKASVAKLADQRINELGGMKIEGRDLRNELLEKAQKAYRFTKAGRFDEARVLEDEVKNSLKTKAESLKNPEDVAFKDDLFRIMRESGTIRKFGKEASIPTAQDWATSLSIPALLGVASDYMSGGKALVARKAGSKYVSDSTKKRLGQVQKALKGELKGERTAAKALSTGGRLATTEATRD